MFAISKYDDVIDSRDVISRIEELHNEREDWNERRDKNLDREWSKEFEDDAQELETLKDLAKQASGYAPDWEHGETLIRGSYFKEYAMELAEDIGAIDNNASWPHACIDWDKAARELQMDYTAVEFDDVTYWIR